MFNLVGQVRDHRVDGQQLGQTFIAQPADTSHFAIKWDGEWQITYETFRDMGVAYADGTRADLPAGGGAVPQSTWCRW